MVYSLPVSSETYPDSVDNNSSLCAVGGIRTLFLNRFTNRFFVKSVHDPEGLFSILFCPLLRRGNVLRSIFYTHSHIFRASGNGVTNRAPPPPRASRLYRGLALITGICRQWRKYLATGSKVGRNLKWSEKIWWRFFFFYSFKIF